MRKFLLTITAAVSLLLPNLAVAPALADSADCTGLSSSRQQVLQGIGESGSTGCDDSGVSSLFNSIVTIISYIAGALAIIMIINAGLKYMTSGGDSNKVGNAKGTLMYALIGVAIAALAQFLVHFVLSESHVISDPCPSNASISVSNSQCKSGS